MNTILLLKENTQPTDSISFKSRPLTRHEDAAVPGCTCDRWGHPCPGCVESKPKTRTTLRKFSLVKK
jgi:hypothetical protein